MKSRMYNLNGIGNIEICKHPKSRKVAIRIRPGSIPRVTIPGLMPYEMGLRFAEEKQLWIQDQTKKIQQMVPAVTFNETLGYKTRLHTIQFQRHTKSALLVVAKYNNVTIFVPETDVFDSDRVQKGIKSIVIELLRTEAKQHLIPRTKELAAQFGFNVKDVFIKNLKSRWGSCSAKNNVNLNIHLMRLPEYLSDFVILHELCHTVHKNHGEHFHQLMNSLIGNEKKLNKELNTYNTQL